MTSRAGWMSACLLLAVSALLCGCTAIAAVSLGKRLEATKTDLDDVLAISTSPKSDWVAMTRLDETGEDTVIAVVDPSAECTVATMAGSSATVCGDGVYYWERDGDVVLLRSDETTVVVEKTPIVFPTLRPSPDGRRLFLSGVAGDDLLSYVLDLSAGETSTVDASWSTVQDVSWLSDSQTLLVESFATEGPDDNSTTGMYLLGPDETIRGRQWQHDAMSPCVSGELVAYYTPAYDPSFGGMHKNPRAEFRLVICDLESRQAIAYCDLPSPCLPYRSPQWTSDGRLLLCLERAAGSNDAVREVWQVSLP
ncbi:MAG: hypothetical protein Q8K99_05070 [Actinomycetota bacterium]|nr:hypothetical protein [Actinomycetota bacterium]